MTKVQSSTSFVSFTWSLDDNSLFESRGQYLFIKVLGSTRQGTCVCASLFQFFALCDEPTLTHAMKRFPEAVRCYFYTFSHLSLLHDLTILFLRIFALHFLFSFSLPYDSTLRYFFYASFVLIYTSPGVLQRKKINTFAR